MKVIADYVIMVNFHYVSWRCNKACRVEKITGVTCKNTLNRAYKTKQKSGNKKKIQRRCKRLCLLSALQIITLSERKNYH